MNDTLLTNLSSNIEDNSGILPITGGSGVGGGSSSGRPDTKLLSSFFRPNNRMYQNSIKVSAGSKNIKFIKLDDDLMSHNRILESTTSSSTRKT